MMAAAGLSMTFSQLASVATNWRLVLRSLVANYLVVPAVTLGLLLLFQPPPMIAVGFLILAACPGAPYGPPFTAIAGGNVPAAIGLMVILAGSSALLAPLLLHLLLPLVSSDEALQVDALQILVTLLATQLAPLCVGMAIRQWRPALAEKLRKPAELTAKLLNLVAVVVIMSVQYQLLLEIRLPALVGMLVLLLTCWGIGWLLGGRDKGVRTAMTLAASLRNVGVGLVIATGAFGGTPAVTAVLVYGLFEVLGSLLLALWWRRRIKPGDDELSSKPQASEC
jgi:BASS family bile acid:Na+ symporter